MDINHILRNAAAVQKDRASYYTDRIPKDAVPVYRVLEGYPGICVWHRGNKPHLYGFRIRLTRDKKVTRYGFDTKEAAIAAHRAMLVSLNLDADMRSIEVKDAQRRYCESLKALFMQAKPGDTVRVDIHSRSGLISQQNYIRNVAKACGWRIQLRTQETMFVILVKGA